MAEMVKNLYTGLYIYAKLGAIMYKYTVETAVFRGINSGIFQPTRTVFGVIGAVSGYREGPKSNRFFTKPRHLSPFQPLFSALPRQVFGVTKMVIFLLAMVITILMTIASIKKTVFGWSENCHFRHRHPLGGRTDKRQKAERPSPEAERPEMYIYTFSENTLRYPSANYPPALAVRKPAPVHRTSPRKYYYANCVNIKTTFAFSPLPLVESLNKGSP